MLDRTEAVLAINPENADALKNLSLFYAHSGEREKALGMTVRSLVLTSEDPDAHFFAALVHCALDDQTLCLRELARSIEYGYSVKLIKAEPALATVSHLNEFWMMTADVTK